MDTATRLKLREIIRKRVAEESSKPLSVAVMGQTGVGKSSLLNGLFGTRLEVGSVRPTTKVPEPIPVIGQKGGKLTFWDMPGIGESDAADAGYLLEYRALLQTADVVLWAVHADTRSTTLDVSALRVLLDGEEPAEQSRLFSKITFVMTKVDQLSPTPWIYAREGRSGTFQPSAGTQRLLAEKARFFGEAMLAPFAHLATAETYNDAGSFDVDDPAFASDEFHIRYSGLMTDAAVRELTERHPRYAAVFERLAVNHRVLACSTRYRYNLLALLVATVNKLGESAVGRFTNVLDAKSRMELVPVQDAASFCDVVVWDLANNRRQFDLTKLFEG